MRNSRMLKIGLTLVAGVAVAGTAVGVTYAATSAASSNVVYACANKPGTLRLLVNGRCPAGFARVALNKQGPRGATGPQGPGAQMLQAASTTNGGSQTTTRTLASLHLVFGVDCKAGLNAAFSIGFDNTAPSPWSISGLTYTDTVQYGLKVNGTTRVGQNGSWGFDEAVDGMTGNYVRMSVAGGRLQGSLLVTRGGHSASVEVALDALASDACSARAQVTPSS